MAFYVEGVADGMVSHVQILHLILFFDKTLTMRFLLPVCIILLIGTLNLRAQGWNPLGPLLELFDQDDGRNFEEEFDLLRDRLLDTGSDGLQLSDLDLGMPIDSLMSYLGGNGSIDMPDSLQEIWMGNDADLRDLLNQGNFSSEDSLSLLGQFGDLNDIWYDQVDSLGNVIGDGGLFDDLPIDFLDIGEDRYNATGGNWERAFNRLERDVDEFRDGFPTDGVDSLTEVIETSLFNSGLDIEMAFGQEWSDIGFYDRSYSARSSLIRIASVPTYRSNIEYRWSIQGSFFNNTEDILSESNSSLEDGLNAFICNANFAFLYQPSFGQVANGEAEFRFYTSIGMDASTYVPSHADPNDPSLADRVGNTTGYGPEIGAGFIINLSGASLYSYATVSSGDVIDAEELGYRYNAQTLNAGIRLGDAVNVRYTYGQASWAPQERKRATYSQFTVGIILDELSR